MGSDYPDWYCPYYLCSFKTSYIHTVKKHLTEVHGATDREVRQEDLKFRRAKYRNLSKVNGYVLEEDLP